MKSGLKVIVPLVLAIGLTGCAGQTEQKANEIVSVKSEEQLTKNSNNIAISTYDCKQIFKDLQLNETTKTETIQYAFSHHMARIVSNGENALDYSLFENEKSSQEQIFSTRYEGYPCKLIFKFTEKGILSEVSLDLSVDDNDVALELDDVYKSLDSVMVACGDITKNSSNYLKSYVLKDDSGVSVTAWGSEDEDYVSLVWRDSEKRDKTTVYYKEDGSLYKRGE